MTDKTKEAPARSALKLALEALECDPLDMALNPDGHMGFRKDQAITAIREALAEPSEALAEQPAQDNTYGYAKSLAETIFKQHFARDEHYASGRIVWEVNNTVIGILTQIDNMVADMVRRPAIKQDLTPEQPAPVAEPRKPQQDPVRHWSDCATNNRGCPELLGTCDCGGIPPKPEPIAWLLEFVDEDGLPRRDVFYESRHLQQHVKHNTDLRGLTCKITSLYTSPPYEATPLASQRSVKPWLRLTDEEVKHEWVVWRASIPRYMGFAKGIEAKLKAKNSP